MSDQLIQEAPLVGIKSKLATAFVKGPKDFGLVERAFMTHVTLRGDPDSPAFRGAVEEVLQLALPSGQAMAASAGGCSAVWMGPDEWLIQSVEETGPELERALRQAMAGEHHAVVDVSSGYTVFELSGRRVREVLAKGCPLDLHPKVLPVGCSTQSHFFKAGITVLHIGEDLYQLVVRRSFAEYACLMLLDAADEFIR
ncbi:sarcosine oxidase, gamma subunit [Pseudogulbenkiania sp. NH8B]|uniref:sarcosine oxidase subunit gamma n=1 Tax=Pseudogulbenkiania sp. (strain NH8B) TaxID=748280 RepID=UPI0002279F4B|nr:sarcosine oxidase subunit gamma family protein [Pseudogulbenkiania sp. NH8B]BAK76169.1 sarcosine oxidase, gamma subunit [Pseudogulbenkiania sp. NH8B]